MTPVIRTAHAWMLTLLLLTGFLSPRVCQACPAESAPPAGQTQTCCDHDAPADQTPPDYAPPEAPENTPAPADPQSPSENGCDCPFGCCAVGAVKALTPAAPSAADPSGAAPWDLGAFASRPVPGRDGPRRPPRI
jgi:hypothetical protein